MGLGRIYYIEGFGKEKAVDFGVECCGFGWDCVVFCKRIQIWDLLWGGDLDWDCGESCGKVGKEWGFARGGVVEKIVGEIGGKYVRF